MDGQLTEDGQYDVAGADRLRVTFENVGKRFGEVEVVSGFNLDVNPGELVTILGPSGSGKTTILNMLAGFTDVTSGRIAIGDRDVTHMPPEARNLGMVFQSFALFPNLSVLDNVAFPLKMRGVSKAERRRQALETLERVDLAAFAQRRPNQLSGGQKQRVSIARALVFRPPVLLMDECLSSLDLKLREQLQIEIRRLHREIGATTLFVTHDQGEAMSLSDRIAVLRDGKLEQYGTPREIYGAPANEFIATFIGKTNLFEVAGHSQKGCTGRLKLPKDTARVSVRPNAIRRGTGDITFAATITDIAFQGDMVEVLARLATGQEVTLQEPAEAAETLMLGETAEFGFAADKAYPLATGRTAPQQEV